MWKLPQPQHTNYACCQGKVQEWYTMWADWSSLNLEKMVAATIGINVIRSLAHIKLATCPPLLRHSTCSKPIQMKPQKRWRGRGPRHPLPGGGQRPPPLYMRILRWVQHGETTQPRAKQACNLPIPCFLISFFLGGFCCCHSILMFDVKLRLWGYPCFGHGTCIFLKFGILLWKRWLRFRTTACTLNT